MSVQTKHSLLQGPLLLDIANPLKFKTRVLINVHFEEIIIKQDFITSLDYIFLTLLDILLSSI